MIASQSAISSMSYFLLRNLKEADCYEETAYEVEVFLNSLETSPVNEVEAFFKSLNNELEEGGYNLAEREVRKKLNDFDCSDFIKECIISNIA